MSAYEAVKTSLKQEPRRWLITGVAGFIGSNLLEALLKLEQRVTGLDNFVSGKKKNLEQVKALVSREQWERFTFCEGDIVDAETCRKACGGVDVVLHEAALGSVPLSMTDPLRCHATNVTGFLNVLLAARDAKVKRVVYASSSAVYGDDPGLPKVEEKIGNPLSPYAASKRMNEIYAETFQCSYGLQTIGLRYFNVFGPRQDPEGMYAAVIPKWISALLSNSPIYINGDGETSRDFCFIENVVQSNLLAALASKPESINAVYNIGIGQTTTLNELFGTLKKVLRARAPSIQERQPIYRAFRPGDVRHSLASIEKAERLLSYSPTDILEQGLQLAMDWYRENLTN